MVLRLITYLKWKTNKKKDTHGILSKCLIIKMTDPDIWLQRPCLWWPPIKPLPALAIPLLMSNPFGTSVTLTLYTIRDTLLTTTMTKDPSLCFCAFYIYFHWAQKSADYLEWITYPAFVHYADCKCLWALLFFGINEIKQRKALSVMMYLHTKSACYFFP